MNAPEIPIPLYTIRTAFSELGRRVSLALRTQMGDAARLQSECDHCERFLLLISQHIGVFMDEEYHTIESSVQSMIQHLNDAAGQSNDPPDALPLETTYVIATGRPGRPRIEIDPSILAQAIELRGPTQLASIFGVSSRTVRRRALDHGFVEPGDPVYVDYEGEDGTITRFYTSSTAPTSTLTNDELDEIMQQILQHFPFFGRRMIQGHFHHLGHKVTRSRILESYTRVHGAPINIFGSRRIQRRVYSVPGPNSLWHHDGQHGLIRWRLVIHAFVDGFSRLVTGIRVSANNRAATVLQLFLDAITEHGTPSRVRGDHGTENLQVAEWMENNRGVDRGSYIWGRSVHNIRIERLWCDVTRGFGVKWKDFFQGLEMHDGLDVNLDAHIWLLHHLFIKQINYDAIQWAEAWNSHSIALQGERPRSPRDMFFFGMLQHGARGIDAIQFEGESDHVGDIQGYGVDWDAFDEDPIRQHHHHANNVDDDNDNPFIVGPLHLSDVQVPEAGCPLMDEQVGQLNRMLQALPHYGSHSMHDLRFLWIDALKYCCDLYQIDHFR